MGIEIDITSVSSGSAPIMIIACFAIVFLLLIYSAIKKHKKNESGNPPKACRYSQKEHFDICKSIAEFAATLSACGATGAQVNSCIAYLSARFGLQVEMIAFPQHILFCTENCESGETLTINEKLKENPLDFDRIIMMTRLTKETVSQNLSKEQFIEKYQGILKCKRLSPNLVLVLASLANASFCRLFNGDAISMVIVAVATASGFYLRRTLVHLFGLDFRLGTILAATVSTIIGSSAYVFHLGDTPNIALATCILYLVPGIPYINSLSDLLNGMFLGCLSHFFKGAILTICLSLGFCIGLFLTNLHFF